jgi:outer membrane protein OmpA-like peptidoglycan-associated protein/tetratricopeptide (TPR) repeat protein
MLNKTHILLILLSFFSINLFAQPVTSFCNEIDDKKLEKSFNKAVDLLMSGKPDDAEIILAKIVDEEPEFTEAWAAMAEINYSRYKNATNPKSQNASYVNYVRCLERIVGSCPSYSNYSVNYSLGRIFFEREEYETAKKYLNTFINNTPQSNKNYADAKNTLEYIDEYLELVFNPVPFKPIIVEGVSTVNDDYLPLISPDGSLAFYTRAYMKKDLSTAVGDKFTEEYTVARALDGSGVRYSPGDPLPYPFNTGKNQGASSITIDNSVLYITICEFISRDYDNCDIFYSIRKGSGWSELVNMGPSINGINTWESQPTISADGKTLYFASIRSDNTEFNEDLPTCDIWYSTKNEDGSWAKAKNMGTSINSAGNEKSPFIHSDSQTLYFSSDGHKGVGGYDIYFTKYRDNAWTKPINIGYPINTKNNDLGFVVNTQGTKAYFASNKLDGRGGWDIYSFDLYAEARPEKVFLVKGQLIDNSGTAITEAKLEVRNVRTEEVSQGVVDQETGHYAVAVTAEKEKEDEYLMVVKKDDYSFTSALIEPTAETFVEPITIDFEIKPIEKGTTVELRDINYATASFEIDKKSLVVLDGFVGFMNDNPSIYVEIRGHTDNVGSLQTNMTLSNNRAKSVYDYLISKGVDSNRLKYQGFGPKVPIASNDTEYGRSKNRRTEFYILAE